MNDYGTVDIASDDPDGDRIPALPAPGVAVTCGLRADLPRKQRRHTYVNLGEDFKNGGEGGIVQVMVMACVVCGKDKRLAQRASLL